MLGLDLYIVCAMEIYLNMIPSLNLIGYMYSMLKVWNYNKLKMKKK